jgi:hypothetical protein
VNCKNQTFHLFHLVFASQWVGGRTPPAVFGLCCQQSKTFPNKKTANHGNLHSNQEQMPADLNKPEYKIHFIGTAQIGGGVLGYWLSLALLKEDTALSG